jgi:hypothetical protein
MAVINLQIQYPDGVLKDIVALPIDQVKFESHFNISLTSLGDNPQVTYLYWLAWHAEKRTKATDLEFDEWLETIEGIGAADEKK